MEVKIAESKIKLIISEFLGMTYEDSIDIILSVYLAFYEKLSQESQEKLRDFLMNVMQEIIDKKKGEI